MLHRTLQLCTKRTPGYVFWRQSTLIELEHSKRNYLLSERPVPIADISRRMIRVKSRYIDTNDFHEQNLLRGEYKYFSGKLCDIRHARPEDMIAYISCGSFFGFWDTAQMDRVMNELLLKLKELEPVELVHLFIALPPLRKQKSLLYQHVARALVNVISELSLEECISICVACEIEDIPQELIENILIAIESEVLSGEVDAAQAVIVIDTISSSPVNLQQKFHSLLIKIKEIAVTGMSNLSVMDIAVLCVSLKILNALDNKTETEAVRLFLERVEETCARSTAMMFTSIYKTFAFSQAMETRVIFLATDFTPSELLSVFSVYVDNYTSMFLISTSTTGGDIMTTVTSQEKEKEKEEKINKNSKYNSFLQHRLEEIHFAKQRQSALSHVLQQLMEQMIIVLESASAYVSPAAQLEYLEVFNKAVEDLNGDLKRLIETLPRIFQCMHLLSAKVISSLLQYTYKELVVLLKLCGGLGKLIADAAVGAAVQELMKRDVGVAGNEIIEICEVLQEISGLRAEHQSRIEKSLLPKLREQSAHAV